jgi:hypothetical protein
VRKWLCRTASLTWVLLLYSSLRISTTSSAARTSLAEYLDALLPVEEQLSDDEYISLRQLTSEMRGWLKRSKEMNVEDVVVVKIQKKGETRSRDHAAHQSPHRVGSTFDSIRWSITCVAVRYTALVDSHGLTHSIDAKPLQSSYRRSSSESGDVSSRRSF